MDKLKKTDSDDKQIKNFNLIRSIPEVDISVSGLSSRVNKEIEEGFHSSPTSDNFMTTQEKPRGIAKYPLLLLNSVQSEVMKERLIYLFEKYRDNTKEELTILYRNNNKAIVLCKTSLVPEVEDILNSYCIDYIYYIKKGQKADFNFSVSFDFKTLTNNIVTDKEEFIEYKDTLKEVEDLDPTVIKAMLKANKYIEEVLQNDKGDNLELKEEYFKELGLVQEETVLEDDEDNLTEEVLINPTEKDSSIQDTYKGTIKSF